MSDPGRARTAGELASAPPLRRLAVRLHLLICRHCAASRQWLDRIDDAARASARRADAEAPADFERRLLERLRPHA